MKPSGGTKCHLYCRLSCIDNHCGICDCSCYGSWETLSTQVFVICFWVESYRLLTAVLFFLQPTVFEQSNYFLYARCDWAITSYYRSTPRCLIMWRRLGGFLITCHWGEFECHTILLGPNGSRQIDPTDQSHKDTHCHNRPVQNVYNSMF